MRRPTRDAPPAVVVPLTAARRRPVPDRRRRSPVHPPVAEEAAVPSAGDRPLLTAVVDTRGGGVRATGHLTVQGADLLRGAVETLRRLGHRRIVLDLGGVGGTDPDGVAALDALRSAPARAVGDLVVRSAPDRPGHPCPR